MRRRSFVTAVAAIVLIGVGFGAHLLVASKRSLCVCEIVDALKLPQYQVSKSLAMLRRAGLVDLDRNGTWGVLPPKS